MLIPVILSGGSGTRLWPLSRKLYPKQLLALTGELTLLQQTAARLENFSDAAGPIIVCNEEHRFLVAEQLRAMEIAPTAIILEPAGRNTAPATAVAALQAMAADPEALLLVLPADHLIRDVGAFRKAVGLGAELAREGKLVTFGIKPDKPETGYGYIKQGETLAGGKKKKTAQAYAVDQFVEKPELNTAKKYLASGDFLWNSGMFLFRADTFLHELQLHAPAMVEACQKSFAAATHDLDFLRLDAKAFAAGPSDSIDYAVFEKTTNAAVVPVDPGWSDIGSWAALWELSTKDANGNVLAGDVMAIESSGSYIRAENRLVATVGVEDLVIVETADAVMVADKKHVQDVKKIVKKLKKEDRQEANLHRRVFRPWGHYETMAAGSRYQVKRITVYPGAVLSLQLHHHRAEHWVVVRGTAKITRDDKVFMLSENESTFIPLGTRHRLENPGVIPLELIEVQSGSYLGEDDIVRFSDNYGRAK